MDIYERLCTRVKLECIRFEVVSFSNDAVLVHIANAYRTDMKRVYT